MELGPTINDDMWECFLEIFADTAMVLRIVKLLVITFEIYAAEAGLVEKSPIGKSQVVTRTDEGDEGLILAETGECFPLAGLGPK